jgi:hypothetical protein
MDEVENPIREKDGFEGPTSPTKSPRGKAFAKVCFFSVPPRPASPSNPSAKNTTPDIHLLFLRVAGVQRQGESRL